MPVINTCGVKAGCIYRIKLLNFVTYKEVELFPGSSLNMIIGPNGSGKSTFVSALILGLCGNIASIGRARKISEYIRSGCTEAEIEIELYQKPRQPNVTITRIFNQKELSKWYIDNKLVSLKNVKDLIATFDIQVDNLCQLLPQDRVKDFSRMKPHDLLQSTLSSIGQHKRVEQLQRLKNWRAVQSSTFIRLEKNKKRKQDLITENQILQTKIDVLNLRREIDQEIQACKSKRLWLEEAEIRKECGKYDKDKTAAERLVRSRAMKIRPLETEIAEKKSLVKELETTKRSINTNINDLRDQANDSLRLVKIQNDKIKDAQEWLLEVETRRANDAKELEVAIAKLDRLQVDLAQAVKKYGGESAMNTELFNLRKVMSGLETKKSGLKQQKDKVEYEFEHNIFPEKARCGRKITMLEDGDRRRLQTLERYSSDAHKALLWLRGNRNLFSGHVCEPMMLEINFVDIRYARYLESTVARRDLVAFTFEKAEDMTLFLQKVRQEQGLKRVNAVCSPPTAPFESLDINKISRFGFQTYLNGTFTAHEMIVRYLCKHYHVHRIPIGDDYTYNNSDSVPAYIPLFFSDNHKFSVKVSRYSGDKSTSILEIPMPFLLADTTDVEKISEFKKNLMKLEKEEQAYNNKKNYIDTKLRELEEEYKTHDAKRKAIQEHSILLQQLSCKIRSQEATVQYKRRPTLNLQEEKEKCEEIQRECARKQVQLHQELIEVLANIQKMNQLRDLSSMSLRKTHSAIEVLEKELFELKNKLNEAKESLNEINQSQEQVRKQAAAKLKEALHSSQGKRPDETGFPLREVYERLPGEMQPLLERCAELNTRVNCMAEGDESDLRTYEENKRMIDQLTVDDTAMRNDNKKLEVSIAKLKEEWLEYMNQLIVQINVHFRDMFIKLTFGGEVRLDQGTNADDFASYGIVISVMFRMGESLRDLTPFEQSGGERAISTAVYLFALQHLATVPFRCVDEINQGMDSQNERKMFEFLVDVTTNDNFGQYFLLTPKLLTGLEYNPKITVHTIMNGRGAMPYSDWQLNSFITRAPSYRQQQISETN